MVLKGSLGKCSFPHTHPSAYEFIRRVTPRSVVPHPSSESTAWNLELEVFASPLKGRRIFRGNFPLCLRMLFIPHYNLMRKKLITSSFYMRKLRQEAVSNKRFSSRPYGPNHLPINTCLHSLHIYSLSHPTPNTAD